MRAAISLLVLVLVAMCGAQTQDEVQAESQSTGAAAAEVSTHPEVSAKLREARATGMELQCFTHNQLQDLVKDLKKDLKAEIEATPKVAELTAVKARLAATKTKVENLEKEIKAAPKVAFSAGLTSSLYIMANGSALNLVFSNVITNVGQAYNSRTGFFTAPVRGVYYFRFNVMDGLVSRWMRIRMHKNGKMIIYMNEYDTDEKATYLSSGLTLQLEKGDTVNMVLPADSRVYDNGDNHSSFSGFLLFPL